MSADDSLLTDVGAFEPTPTGAFLDALRGYYVALNGIQGEAGDDE